MLGIWLRRGYAFYGGWLASWILEHYKWGTTTIAESPAAYTEENKLEILFGPSVWEQFRGKAVIDFGCEVGNECAALIKLGQAERVVGLEIRPKQAQIARDRIASLGLSSVISIAEKTQERADIIISLDSFEHYHDPADVLCIMASLLKPNGYLLVSFGPPWKHPYGGHGFSVFTFPWAHLFLSEKSLISWRNKFSPIAISSFNQMDEGLNQMTVAKFIKLIEASPFQFDGLKCFPIRGTRLLYNRLTRELLTSTIRCKLRLKP